MAIKHIMIWAASWQNQQSDYAPSEDSDAQSVQSRSAWASAQSDQSLRCALSG